jgi:hypothetical protein
MSINLFDFKNDVFSQNGEDGILEKLLRELSIENGFFVEFGAWDGKHLSNTHNLYQKGWKGCLIEANEERFQDLMRSMPDTEIHKVNAIVEETGENSLNQILERGKISTIDLLSIDIDSDDLRVWESLQNIRPSIVIIEYNPVIPFDTRFINPKGQMYGNSALSITESAINRGYVLVEGTDTNLIYVDRNLLIDCGIDAKPLQAIKDQSFQLRYFVGYDGTLLHNFDKMNDAGITEFFPVPWALSFGIQPVPKFFRRYHERPHYLAIFFFLMAAIIRSPLQLLKLLTFIIKTTANGRSVGETIKLIMDKGNLTKTFKDK